MVQDRPGGPPSHPAEPLSDAPEYQCDCPGFAQLRVELMCLRCLEAYSGGLEMVLSGEALTAEMARVATRLAALLQGDPLMGNLPLRVAIQAAR